MVGLDDRDLRYLDLCWSMTRIEQAVVAAVAARQGSSNAARPRGLHFRRTGNQQDQIAVRLIGVEEMQETGEESRWETVTATFLLRCLETLAICLT